MLRRGRLCSGYGVWMKRGMIALWKLRHSDRLTVERPTRLYRLYFLPISFHISAVNDKHVQELYGRVIHGQEEIEVA